MAPRAHLAAAGATAAVAAASLPAYYLGALTLLGAAPHRCGTSTTQRFVIVIPAHNEAGCIEATLESMQQLDYPGDRVEVVVVADNCTDDTAALARGAGARVIERFSDTERGKGYALAEAFEQLLADDATSPDALCVVDADTLVAADFLQRAAHHLDHGAPAIQVDYQTRNPAASWRTRLTDVAFTCKHRVRSRGRDTIGASAGLRGNGMVFAADTVRRQPYHAFSVVEDVEYAIMLGRNGLAVQPCDATSVAGDMPDTEEMARSQRVRWELGNAELRRQHGWPLFRSAAASRDVVRADLAADVLVPPMASVFTMLTGATAVSLVARRLIGRGPLGAAGLGWLAIGAHLVAGIALSRSGWRALPALARVPGYIAWKASLRLSSTWRQQASDGPTWTRTERSATAGHHATDDGPADSPVAALAPTEMIEAV